MTLEFLDSSSGDRSAAVLLGGMVVLGFGLGLLIGNAIMNRCLAQCGDRRSESETDPQAEEFFRLQAT